jgi:hypothetical protein
MFDRKVGKESCTLGSVRPEVSVEDVSFNRRGAEERELVHAVREGRRRFVIEVNIVFLSYPGCENNLRFIPGDCIKRFKLLRRYRVVDFGLPRSF